MEGAELKAWRKEQRAALIAARMALSSAAHKAASQAILGTLEREFPGLVRHRVGFCWPYQREVNPLPFIDRLLAAGGTAAMPVVLGKGLPLEFRPWDRTTRMAKGVYDIPHPDEGEPVVPGALLVPIVGFDAGRYRLGYGGGYFDRTLAAYPVRPIAIAVGFALGRLETIHPQPHDIPMDCVVTEEGVLWGDPSLRERLG